VMTEGFTSTVPSDIPGGLQATTAEKVKFAWQEFVALNWPAQIQLGNASGYNRGVADSTVSPGSKNRLAVWQTFKHRSEALPYNFSTTPAGISPINRLPEFDSAVTYSYKNQPTPGTPSSKFNLFTNLDESVEVGNVQMFYRANKQPILYEAKLNQKVYNYIRSNGLQDTAIKNKQTKKTAVYLSENKPLIPAGSAEYVSYPSGSIEVKATWRMYDPNIDTGKEAQYLMSEGVYYANGVYLNAKFMLLGLHIIHKTPTVPTFVFTTFEHITNSDKSFQSINDLTGLSPTYPNQKGIRNVIRQYAIPSEIEELNTYFQKQLKSQFGSDVFLANYRVTGVQVKSTNAPGVDGVTAQEYFLANLATESDCNLQVFSGGQNFKTDLPLPDNKNLYAPDSQGNYQQKTAGGCNGCHGSAQKDGAEFSFVLLGGPFEFANINPYPPEGTFQVQDQNCSGLPGITTNPH